MIPELVLQAGLAAIVFGILALREPIVARLASLDRGAEDLDVEN